MIYITDYIDDPDLELSVIGENLCSFSDEKIDHSKISILLVWHFSVNETTLRDFPSVKAVVRYGVGFDNIDLEYCKKNGIKVFNNPDYGVDEVSDTALSMIMSLSRCIESYNITSRELVLHPNKAMPWQENTDKRAKRLKNITLGIVGVGRIGSALAIKMKNIVGDIHFFDPEVVSGYEKVLGATRHNSLDDLLGSSDIVTIHTPLSLSTKGMIDENFIESMKDGSILVNTARGGILKSHGCLYQGLLSGKLSGVGFDVIPQEPPVLKDDDELLKTWIKNDEKFRGRIIVNPHTAYYSEDSYQEMRTKAATAALMALTGNQTSNRIV
jgi:C-terminal binding protein